MPDVKISRTRRNAILAEVKTWPEWKREFYVRLRRKGQSVPMAHMLASRQAPRSLTDDVVMSGQKRIKDLPDGYREQLCNDLKRQGASVSMWDTYMPSMGMNPHGADPNAVLGHGDCVGKIRRVCRQRGVDSYGIVDVKGSRCQEEKPPGRVHRLHPRIVERYRRKMLAEDPSLAAKDQSELRQAIIDKHAQD